MDDFCKKGHDRTLPNANSKEGKCVECILWRQRRKRLSMHGFTVDLYDYLYEQQDGRCAICRNPEWVRSGSGRLQYLAIDHDHITGKVRGLLCSNCNQGLGRFADDIGRLEAAIRYLRK